MKKKLQHPVTSVEVTCSEAILAISFSTLGKVFDENTRKVSTINGWQYLRWMSTSSLRKMQGYSFSVKLTLGCVHKF